MHTDISVTLSAYEKTDLTPLKQLWLSLEKDVNCSFFLTWAWMGGWLKQCQLKKQTFHVLCAKQGNEVVALAIIVKKSRKVLGFLTIEQWWLNRSGDDALDQCWIEENTFLMKANCQTGIQQALLNFIKLDTSWQEFIVGMSDSETINTFSSLTSSSRLIFDDIGYAVNFDELNNETDYSQQVLSRNTRQKIKQSEKILNQQGALTFGALSEQEKKHHIEEISRLHQKRWQHTATPSGFNNPHFNQIFQNFIESYQVEIVYLALNEKILGYLVFFVHQNTVSFYLSALSTVDDNKVKLGMLLHKKAIMHYMKKGYRRYDFLAGDARYKQSLTHHSYSQKMVCFYRLSHIFFYEKIIRKLKGKIKNIALFGHKK